MDVVSPSLRVVEMNSYQHVVVDFDFYGLFEALFYLFREAMWMLYRLRYELSKCEVNGSVVVSHLITPRYYVIRVSESGVSDPRFQSKK